MHRVVCIFALGYFVGVRWFFVVAGNRPDYHAQEKPVASDTRHQRLSHCLFAGWNSVSIFDWFLIRSRQERSPTERPLSRSLGIMSNANDIPDAAVLLVPVVGCGMCVLGGGGSVGGGEGGRRCLWGGGIETTAVAQHAEVKVWLHWWHCPVRRLSESWIYWVKLLEKKKKKKKKERKKVRNKEKKQNLYWCIQGLQLFSSVPWPI